MHFQIFISGGFQRRRKRLVTEKSVFPGTSYFCQKKGYILNNHSQLIRNSCYGRVVHKFFFCAHQCLCLHGLGTWFSVQPHIWDKQKQRFCEVKLNFTNICRSCVYINVARFEKLSINTLDKKKLSCVKYLLSYHSRTQKQLNCHPPQIFTHITLYDKT